MSQIPTQKKFFCYLKQALQAHYCWAREDEGRLDRYIHSDKAYVAGRGHHMVEFSDPLYSCVWKHMGGEGRGSWPELRALPPE